MKCYRQIILFTLLAGLAGCASQSSKAIAKLDDKSPDFATGACQNARHNAWIHDEIKTHKLWATPALVLLTGPAAVAPLFLANVGANTADHVKAAEITTQCGGQAPSQEAMIGSIAVDTAVGLAVGVAMPVSSSLSSAPTR